MSTRLDGCFQPKENEYYWLKWSLAFQISLVFEIGAIGSIDYIAKCQIVNYALNIFKIRTFQIYFGILWLKDRLKGFYFYRKEERKDNGKHNHRAITAVTSPSKTW